MACLWMIGMIEEAGFRVRVATSSGEPILGWNGENVILKPDLKLSDVKINDYYPAWIAIQFLIPQPQSDDLFLGDHFSYPGI